MPKPESASLAPNPNPQAIGGDPAKVGPWIYNQSGILIPGAAHVTAVVRDKTFELQANSAYGFPHIYVSPKDKLALSVSLPKAKPGDPVMIEAADGGDLGDGKGTLLLHADANGGISFPFQTGQFQGIYHLVIRTGGAEQTLPIWAGPLQ